MLGLQCCSATFIYIHPHFQHSQHPIAPGTHPLTHPPNTQLSYSVGTGAATRIANALGAGHSLNAKRIFRLASCLLLVFNTLVASSLWLTRRRLTALLTPDSAVAAEMMRILPAAILGVIGDGQVAVLGGLMRAAGRQSTGALLHFITYWLVGLPLGCLLGFYLDWGALGLWMGVASATALQAVALHSWVALRLDWGHEVKRSEAIIEALLDSHAIADLADEYEDEEVDVGAVEAGGDAGEKQPLVVGKRS